jgi:hypothetical protein
MNVDSSWAIDQVGQGIVIQCKKLKPKVQRLIQPLHPHNKQHNRYRHTHMHHQLTLDSSVPCMSALNAVINSRMAPMARVRNTLKKLVGGECGESQP